MSWKREWKIFAALVAIFVVAYALPLGNPKIQEAIQEAFSAASVVCAQPHLGVCGACPVYCGSYHHLFVSELGNALSWAKF